jgi:hypothetical protein
MGPTEVPLNVLRRPVARFTRVLVWTLIVVGTQVRLESVRWWWSPPIVSALAMTEQQSTAIERLYQESLPMRQHASEDETGLTDDIVKRLDDGLYDDELLHITERLAGAWVKQRDVRRQTFNRAVQVLTPRQRDKLTYEIAERQIVE